MTPNTQQNTNPTMAWYRIQSGVAAQLSDRQAPALYNCFEAVLQGDELVVTAPRGYAEALNQVARRSASLNAQKLRVAESVRFVEPEPEPEPESDLWAEIDHTAVDDSEYEPIQPVPTSPSLPAPKPTALRTGQPGYDPWQDTERLLATVKSYQAEKRRGTAVSAPAPESHEQVAIESDAEPEQDKSEPMTKKEHPDLAPHVVWKATLSELELQMTRATFNTWLKDTRGAYDPDTAVLTVHCRNEYAVEWLTERLAETVARTASLFAGCEVTAVFVVDEQRPKNPAPVTAVDNGQEPQEPQETEEPLFDDLSWPDPRKNFTMTPDHLFEEILPRTDIKPSTKTLVQIILYNTLGNLDKNMKPREWWEDVSQGDLCYALGITPKTLRVAINEALKHRMIKRRKASRRHCFDYALLFKWEGGEWDEDDCA